MTKCKKLWDIWFLTYLIVINLYLTYNAILNYLNFKVNASDPLYGRNWDMNLTYLILECIIIPLGLLPVIIYTNILPVGNFANDGKSLGKDEEFFHFILNENGKADIVLNNKERSCCKQRFLKLIFMELPPISYVLQVIAAYCYLIPKPFMDARQIFHKVLRPNQIWHTDLDIIFDPDYQHPEFTYYQQWSYIQPMTVAYFNFGFSLFLLSIQYSRVFWNVSKTFTLVLSFIMLTFSLHLLVEYCSLAVMIKIIENPLVVSSSLRLELNVSTVVFLSILANFILLFSFTTIFHYGILQYGDIMLHRNRRIRRQILNSSPHIVGSNQLDMSGPFSPCASENNYSESSIEPVFSKSHYSHILAVCFLIVVIVIKSPIIHSSFKHIYYFTSDSLTLVHMLISCLYVVSWLIIWFAFALRRTWNFKIKSTVKSNTDQILLNGNTLLNNNGHMQLHQMQNSFLLNPKTSELNLSKQEMLTANRNGGLDGCSDETDMSSKLSSSNYVYLQSMRGNNIGFDMNSHASLLRNPMYLSYTMNNPNMMNPNAIYANDDSLNIRSTHLEDQLGSEHSYNSSRSRNLGFEILPPTLPNFDENRYKHFNTNSAAIDKLIPRYLRNQSIDMNGSIQLSMPINDMINNTATTTTMSYTFDNNLQNFSNRFKQSNMSNSQLRSPEKYSSVHGMTKSGVDQIDFLLGNSDDDMNRRGFLNGDSSGRYSTDSTKRHVKSPIIFQTVEENTGDSHQIETDSLHPKFGNINLLDHINVMDMVSGSGANSSTDIQNSGINSPISNNNNIIINTNNNNNNNNNINNINNNNNNNINNNNTNATGNVTNQPNDRMCSQV